METYDSVDSGAATAIAAMLGTFFLIFAVVGLICIIAMWKIFTKAGKPGWAAIIPIYSTIVMLEIIGKPIWWLVIILLVPIANLVFAIMMIHELSKSFGKDVGMTLLLIFLPFIGYPVLGFGSAQYIGPGGVPAGTARPI